MSSWFADLVYSTRALRRRGRFTATAVIVLTLGIGASIAVFSFVNAMLVRPLPYHEPDRLTLLWSTAGQSMQLPVTWPDFEGWHGQVPSLESLAALDIGEVTLASDTGAGAIGGAPEQVIAARVSPEFFPLLGVRPLLGRVLRGEAAAQDSDRPRGHAGAEDEVVVSYRLWQRRFGGAADIVGRRIALGDRVATIVGVMPRTFWFLTQEFDLWVPLRPAPSQRANRQAHTLFVTGRLRPGATVARAQAELGAVAARVQEAANDPQPRGGVRVGTLDDELRQSARPTLIALSGAVSCLLLLACANLANLLLTRGLERQRELAIRLALGGSRTRIVRLFLTESLVLALVSGALGLLLAAISLPLFTALLPLNLPMPVPGLDDVRIDRTVLLFTLLAALGTATLFSAWPALVAARANAHDTLKAAGTTLGGGLAKRRGRMALISAELALAVLLLIAGGLMARSLIQLEQAPLGFTPDGVLTLNAPDTRAATASPDAPTDAARARTRIIARMQQRLGALPGVTHAGLVDTLPLSGASGRVALTVIAPGTGGAGAPASALRRAASAEYFLAMDIRLRDGRLFEPRDTEDGAPVALISESMAREYWGSTNPIGRTFAVADDAGGPLRIVGIVADVRHWMGRAPAPTFYRPYLQAAPRSVSFVLRAEGDAMRLGPAAQRAIWEVEPAQPIRYVRAFDGDMGDQIWTQRLGTRVLALFALIALVLAATGVFGVMATLVAQRTREIGIRTALGADTRAILRLVMTDALRWIAAGLAAGVAGALLLTRYLGSVLYAITVTDPGTFAGVTLLMSAVAVLACYLPARRASRIAPVEALSERQ